MTLVFTNTTLTEETLDAADEAVLLAAVAAIAFPADPDYCSILSVENVLSAYARRRLARGGEEGGRALAESAQRTAGLRITFRVATIWDLRGRTSAGADKNMTSTGAVCSSMTGQLAANAADQGEALIAAVRAAAAAAGITSLAHSSVNASASVLPDSCEAPHVPLPSPVPTPLPSAAPTPLPSEVPTAFPTLPPTPVPTNEPTPSPTPVPTDEPTPLPSSLPTALPTAAPTPVPTDKPSPAPTDAPTPVPSSVPTSAPTPVLRGYQQCVCVTAGVARKLKSWCPSIAHQFDGESCLSNVTTAELYDLVADCPPLQTTFFSD